MTIVLAKPTTVRRCIRCGLPISFSFDEIPIVASRQDPTPLATFFAHPSAAACADEKLRRAPDANPSDIGVQRARLLDELLADIKAAHVRHTRNTRRRQRTDHAAI